MVRFAALHTPGTSGKFLLYCSSCPNVFLSTKSRTFLEFTWNPLCEKLTPGVTTMPRVVFILGLCGSGKSTRANELAAQGFMCFDEKITGRPVHPNLQAWANSAYPEFGGKGDALENFTFEVPG